jgi:hypothetical protein
MHNCRSARNEIAEILLGESDQSTLREVENCPRCREELVTAQNVLHISGQALRAPVAEEDFWPGYHARLSARLLDNSSEKIPATTVSGFWSRPWLAMRAGATSSIRLPIPAALALLLLFSITIVAVAKLARSTGNPATPSVVHDVQKVEIPIVKEKIVSHVVYVESKTCSLRQRGGANTNLTPDLANRVAATRTPKAALSLTGFKPTDRVKLTVIKGAYHDEK